MKAINKILKSYPESKNHCISEVFKIGSIGWVKLWGVNLPNLNDKVLQSLSNENIHMVNIYFKDEFEADKFVDYNIKELLNN